MDIEAALFQGQQILEERRKKLAQEAQERRDNDIAEFENRVRVLRNAAEGALSLPKALLITPADYLSATLEDGSLKAAPGRICFSVGLPNGGEFFVKSVLERWDAKNPTVTFSFPVYSIYYSEDCLWEVGCSHEAVEDWTLCAALASEAHEKKIELQAEADQRNAEKAAEDEQRIAAKDRAQEARRLALEKENAEVEQFTAMMRNAPRNLRVLFQAFCAVYEELAEMRGGLEE